MLRNIIGIICSTSVLLTLVSGCENDNSESSVIDEATATAVISDSALSLTDNEGIEAAVSSAYDAYVTSIEDRKTELSDGAITIGDIAMRLDTQIIGEQDDNGYPLYIALHGGGEEDAEVNDDQWEQMKEYYADSVDHGVYVAARGIRDTWNTHFNDESYAFYDRIIEDAMAFYGVDPNRVYLLGFSAGGDGVYAISPRMADRFAAVNMSSGHPNGVSMLNMSNLPIILQVGEEDTLYDRHLNAAVYDDTLNQLSELYEGSYIHKTLIHVGMGHNYEDYGDEDQEVVENISEWYNNGGTGGGSYFTDTNAVRLVNEYSRNPLPEKLIWQIQTNAEMRDVKSFYWLSRDETLTSGTVYAVYGNQAIMIGIDENDPITDGTLKVYVNSKMMDLFSLVTISVDGNESEVELTPSLELIQSTLQERGDPNYAFPCEIVNFLNNYHSK